ncbi:hypothetical protein MN205_15255 [Kineococcus sp. TRM81007]|uniref:hypothetical protein n=1 Tax=Kineococcus sp. TRM81007 TaxID=2925831 RepID=UPI001F590FCE|nr:hypothetical protein [Kineococcus sp. TRM81007]MCI2239835.1 hypothetical protein [Kineococcus sp. TRM81007]
MREVVLVLSTAGLLTLTACGGAPAFDSPAQPGALVESRSTPTPSVTPAPEDVVLGSCAADGSGQVAADLTVTNTADEPRSYLVTVSVAGPDGERLTQAHVAAPEIAAGGSAQVRATAPVAGAPAQLTCEVAQIHSF